MDEISSQNILPAPVEYADPADFQDPSYIVRVYNDTRLSDPGSPRSEDLCSPRLVIDEDRDEEVNERESTCQFVRPWEHTFTSPSPPHSSAADIQEKPLDLRLGVVLYHEYTNDISTEEPECLPNLPTRNDIQQYPTEAECVSSEKPSDSEEVPQNAAEADCVSSDEPLSGNPEDIIVVDEPVIEFFYDDVPQYVTQAECVSSDVQLSDNPEDIIVVEEVTEYFYEDVPQFVAGEEYVFSDDHANYNQEDIIVVPATEYLNDDVSQSITGAECVSSDKSLSDNPDDVVVADEVTKGQCNFDNVELLLDGAKTSLKTENSTPSTSGESFKDDSDQSDSSSNTSVSKTRRTKKRRLHDSDEEWCPNQEEEKYKTNTSSKKRRSKKRRFPDSNDECSQTKQAKENVKDEEGGLSIPITVQGVTKTVAVKGIAQELESYVMAYNPRMARSFPAVVRTPEEQRRRELNTIASRISRANAKLKNKPKDGKKKK